jgi:hypothetical protein
MIFTRDRAYACVLFVLTTSLYYATLSGITCSNDGSHFALVRALVDRGRFELAPWDGFAEKSDYAVVDGRTYSDRPPGTAFLTALAYRVGKWLPGAPDLLPSRHDAENPALIYVMLVPVLFGAATVTGVFRLLRWWGVSLEAAFAAAAILAVGTLQWKYSSVLFSHAVSGFLVFMVFSMAVRADAERLKPWAAAAMGGMLGMSVVVEYSNLLYAGIVSAFLWLRRDRLWRTPVALLGFAIALAVPLVALGLYNTRVFGGPLQHSYTATVHYSWTHSLGGIFSGSLLTGLRGMLLYTPDLEIKTVRFGMLMGVANQGVVWMSPVLLFAVPGFWRWGRQHAWRPAVLAIVTVVAYLALFAMHRTFHAYTRDARYFTPFLPLLALGVGFSLHRLFARTPNSPFSLFAYALLFALLAISIRNVASHIALSFNYQFQYRNLKDIAVEPRNVAYFFSSLFPNWRDLPRLWTLLAVCAVPWLVWLRFASARPALGAAPAGASTTAPHQVDASS